MDGSPVLLSDDRDGVATLTLNRPDKYNALSEELLDALIAALDAIESDPANGQAYGNLAHSKRCSEADLAEILPAERLLREESLSPETQSEIHFALGKVHDDVGRWEKAFRHYEEANRLAGKSYDLQGLVRYVDALIETFGGPLPRCMV